MRYLSRYKKEFRHQVRKGDLSLHLQDHAAADILEPIVELIELRHHEKLRRSLARCLQGDRSRLFVKTVEIDSLPARIRATLGLRRRSSGHIWPVAELLNSVEANRLGAPVPRVLGFGYCRRGLSLVRELFLVSEMLDGHVNGLDWLQVSGAEVEPFLRQCFALFLQLHQREIFHLDLWLANIMLDPANPDKLRVVDLENCHIGKTQNPAEALGFQFGFFYFRFVHQHIDEQCYDRLVEEALQAYGAIDRERFERVYQALKHHPISRKKRRDLILRGVLQTK